jgi:hypothetical protein
VGTDVIITPIWQVFTSISPFRQLWADVSITFDFATLGWLSRRRGSIQEFVERIGRLSKQWVPISSCSFNRGVTEQLAQSVDGFAGVSGVCVTKTVWRHNSFYRRIDFNGANPAHPGTC